MNNDRFIPQRNLEQMDFSSYQLFKEVEDPQISQQNKKFDNIASEELYNFGLRDTLFNQGSSRNFDKILLFRDNDLQKEGKPSYSQRDLRKFRNVSPDSIITLSIPDRITDFYSNLTDWYSSNIVGICTRKVFYIGDVKDRKMNTLEEFVTNYETSTMKFTVDNKFISSLSNNELYIFDMNNFSIDQKLLFNSVITTIDASKKNNYLYGDMDGNLWIHDTRVKTNEPYSFKMFNNRITSISRNSDTLFALMDSKSNFKVYDQRFINDQNTILNYNSSLNEFTYGKGLSFCPWRNDLLLYENIYRGLNYITFINPYNNNIYEKIRIRKSLTGISWSDIDKEFILSYEDDKNAIELWNLSLLQLISKFDTSDSIISIASNKDGTKLSSISPESLSIWNINKKKEVPISKRSIFNQHSMIR